MVVGGIFREKVCIYFLILKSMYDKKKKLKSFQVPTKFTIRVIENKLDILIFYV